MELSEEKSAHKISKRNEEKNRLDCDKLTVDVARLVVNNRIHYSFISIKSSLGHVHACYKVSLIDLFVICLKKRSVVVYDKIIYWYF